MRQIWLCAVAFVVLWSVLFVGTIWHPTDYEWVMGMLWRQTHGELPYRDFIYHKPYLTLLLHFPWMVLPDWLMVRASRVFVVCQFAFAGFAPMLWAAKKRMVTPGAGVGLIAAAGAAFAAHTFPLTPWPTIDGVCLATAAMLCFLESRETDDVTAGKFWLNNASWLFGLAFLCKQSFLPVLLFYAALYFVEIQRWEKYGHRQHLWAHFSLLIFTIAATTLAWMWFSGARAVTSQLSSTGIQPLIDSLIDMRKFDLGRLAWFFGVGLLLAMLGQKSETGPHKAFKHTSLMWLGFVLMLGLSCEISLGYVTPWLGLGGLGLCVALTNWPRYVSVLMVVASVVLVAWVTSSRNQAPYRDGPADWRTEDLGDTFPALTGIATNRGTHARYADLARVLHGIGGQPFVVTQDYPGAHWLSHTRPPTHIDWYYQDEIHGFEDFLWGELESNPMLLAVVPKEYAAPFAGIDATPAPHCMEVNWAGHNVISRAVVSNWRLTGESEFFCLFEH